MRLFEAMSTFRLRFARFSRAETREKYQKKDRSARLNSLLKNSCARATSVRARVAEPCVRPLKNNPRIPLPPRDTFAVEILEQWNSVFARDTGDLLESRHIEALPAK